MLAAASSTAAGASDSPVVEAGGAPPVPDPLWMARASTYDTACSASDADLAKYVQCIAMHVDDSVSTPAHATDASCVLASLVADDALGLANCRFVAQRLGRAAFDAGAAARPSEAETVAREAFGACHASFCGGGCAQGVLVGMLVRAHGEGSGSIPAGGDALAATAARAFRTCAATPGAGASAHVADATSATVAGAAAPVTCAAGIGQGLFAATQSLPSAVSLCHAAAVAIAAERAAANPAPAADRTASETRARAACVSGALLRDALAKVTERALDATAMRNATSSASGTPLVGEARVGTRDAAPGIRDGFAAARAPFVETAADAAPPREPNPALRGAALGRAAAMLATPSSAADEVFAERLCGILADPAIAGACAAAFAAAAARAPPRAAFPSCAARGETVAEAATDGGDSDAAATKRFAEWERGSTRSLASAFEEPAMTNALEGAATNASAATNAGCDAFFPGPDPVSGGFDFGFGGCALASEGAGFRVATARGGSPEVASLPFCGEVVAYPIAAGAAAHHRAEDDGIAAAHARALAALETTEAFAGDAEKDACAFALKTEMCRTAFSACDLTAGNAELEYCAHAHVPSFGADAAVVGVCSRPDRNVGDGKNGDEDDGSANRKRFLGARAVCGAHWNGVACFSLPAACGAARDTPEGTCPAGVEVWRGMSTGCFYASREADEKAARPEELSAFAEFVAVSKDALESAPPRALATPESAAACASLRRGSGGSFAEDEGFRLRVTDAEPFAVPRNVTSTARDAIAVVREHAAEAFGRIGAENGTDPRRAFVQSDRETGGAVWIFCARALVAGSLAAAAWTCARGWFGGAEIGQTDFVRQGSRRAPNGGPAFFRLKQTCDVKPAPGDGSGSGNAAELADLPTTTKGSSLATLPKRGVAKASPESKGGRRAVESPL